MCRPPMFLAALCALTACTLQQPAIPDNAVLTPPATASEVEILRQQVEVLRQQLVDVETRVHPLEPLAGRMALLETLTARLSPPRKGAQARPAKEPTPLQVITMAQRDARIQPTAVGYWGKSAEQVYTWVPGKIFTVYLAPSQATLITLPAGERLVVGLLLDKDAYEVQTERVGTDLLAYDVLFIRPKEDKGEIDSAVVTESGRRYLFHFIVGKIGMIAITFETPTITPAQGREPRLILPRPTP